MGFNIYQNPDGFIAVNPDTTKRLEALTLEGIILEVSEYWAYDDSDYCDDKDIY